MSDMQIEEIIELALQLSPVEQAHLIERLEAAMSQSAVSEQDNDDEAPWTREELAEMMKVTPKTGAEIVASGVLGGWANKGITDGAEWVNEQKRKRKERRRW